METNVPNLMDRISLAVDALAGLRPENWHEREFSIRPGVSLGASLPEGLVVALAKELGGEFKEHSHWMGGAAFVIFAFCAEVEGVQVSGQGSRTATAEDIERLGRPSTFRYEPVELMPAPRERPTPPLSGPAANTDPLPPLNSERGL